MTPSAVAGELPSVAMWKIQQYNFSDHKQQSKPEGMATSSKRSLSGLHMLRFFLERRSKVVHAREAWATANSTRHRDLGETYVKNKCATQHDCAHGNLGETQLNNKCATQDACVSPPPTAHEFRSLCRVANAAVARRLRCPGTLMKRLCAPLAALPKAPAAVFTFAGFVFYWAALGPGLVASEEDHSRIRVSFNSLWPSRPLFLVVVILGLGLGTQTRL